jgi:hypothetical protein
VYKWWILLCELYVLFVFVNSSLLMPGAIDSFRIVLVCGTAVLSCALALWSSYQFRAEGNGGAKLKNQLLIQPPLVIWSLVFFLVAVSLAVGLAEQP